MPEEARLRGLLSKPRSLFSESSAGSRGLNGPTHVAASLAAPLPFDIAARDGSDRSAPDGAIATALNPTARGAGRGARGAYAAPPAIVATNGACEIGDKVDAL
ncbi:MAG: hypothetical protein ABIQ52_14595 [Vicinamibacterales bacterium]